MFTFVCYTEASLICMFCEAIGAQRTSMIRGHLWARWQFKRHTLVAVSDRPAIYEDR